MSGSQYCAAQPRRIGSQIAGMSPATPLYSVTGAVLAFFALIGLSQAELSTTGLVARWIAGNAEVDSSSESLWCQAWHHHAPGKRATRESFVAAFAGHVVNWPSAVNGFQAISSSASARPVLKGDQLYCHPALEFSLGKWMSVAHDARLDPQSGYFTLYVVVRPTAFTNRYSRVLYKGNPDPQCT